MRVGRRACAEPWYHATDHKVSHPFIQPMATIESPPQRPERRFRRGSTAIPRWPSASSAASSSAPGSSRRTSSSLPEPGSYFTASAGTQPVLLLRDEQGTLRAFRNVCRHRGSRLLSGSGECGKAIRCRYHGWTYRLDGKLIGVPEARSIPGLDKSQLGLFPARVETLAGLVFVNLDVHAPPLAEQFAGLGERLAPYGIEGLVPRPSVQRHASRRTGRSSRTTTSRATTSRSPIPG